ncbi:unnamed protein product [Leptosia nina]|uniref:C2H2-type domain-containing protein n=1 Tax=Leptosia nina TaxID=320188 RepID=A0AAV1JR55_9NEOP
MNVDEEALAHCFSVDQRTAECGRGRSFKYEQVLNVRVGILEFKIKVFVRKLAALSVFNPLRGATCGQGQEAAGHPTRTGSETSSRAFVPQLPPHPALRGPSSTTFLHYLCACAALRFYKSDCPQSHFRVAHPAARPRLPLSTGPLRDAADPDPMRRHAPSRFSGKTPVSSMSRYPATANRGMDSPTLTPNSNKRDAVRMPRCFMRPELYQARWKAPCSVKNVAAP